MITKERLYSQIESMPNNIEIEVLIEKLLFIDKLEKRIALSDQNQTVDDDELEKEIEKW